MAEKRGFLGMVRRVWAAITDTTNLKNPARWLVEWTHGGLDVDAGVTVNAETSMSIASVWYAVNRIAGGIAQLPLVLYQRVPGELRDNREKAKKHPAFPMMRTRPNRDMTAGVFRETLTSHALLWGNGYAYISRLGSRPDELIILSPDETYPFRVYDENNKDDWRGQLWYKTTVRKDDGGVAVLVLRPDEVFHLRGLGWDGLRGHSVISLARNSFGLAIAGEKHGARFFRNNARPGILLEAPEGAFKTDEQAKQFLKEWNEHYSGVEQANKTALLRRGVKANTLSMSNEDSQWLESRKFQRVEVALWFGLEHITGDDSSVSYNSLEQKSQAFLQYTMQRWLTRWEEESNAKLLTELEQRRDTHYFEFNTKAFLKGSTIERYNAYAIGIQNEWLSPDDVREAENMNERPDGEGGEYGNPNVKSGSSAPAEPVELPPEPDEPDDDPSDAVGNTLRQMVTKAIQRDFEFEAKRVINASKRHKAFLAWADKFYEKWRSEFGKTLEMVGGDQQMADKEIGKHCEQLLAAVAGGSDKLTDTLGELVEQWRERPEQLADQIVRRQIQEVAA